jgi:hypothetical protein
VIVSIVSAIDVSSGDQVQIKLEDHGLVAKGGWATVYRAKIVPDGEVIAIKKVKETRQYKVASSVQCRLTVASRDGDLAIACTT